MTAAGCRRSPKADWTPWWRPPAGLEEKWNGPYLKKSQLLDPWGNPYIYMREGQVNPGSFDLISYGADGQQGGEGENADIVND